MLESIKSFFSQVFTTIVIIMFYAAPLAAIILSTVCLYRFSSVKKRNRLAPGSVPEETVKKLKTNYIISAVVATAFAAAFIAIMIMIIFFSTNVTKENKESEEKVSVVATLFPQYDFVKQIGKEKVNVTLLLPPGTETHTYDPSPKDIININKSKLFIYTGKYMEPWAESIANSIDKSVIVLDASKNISYIKEDHDGEGHEETSHEHEYDPHIWLDISNAKKMVDNILEELINVDGQNADYYTQNAKEYKEKLDELDSKFKEVINNGKRNVICFGDKFAYMYFISSYNLDYITAYEGCGSNAEPSVSKILEVEEKIKKENIPVIFYESLSEGTVAKSIAKDTNTTPLVFSSVHTVSSEDIQNGATYISVMENNLNNLKKALN